LTEPKSTAEYVAAARASVDLAAQNVYELATFCERQVELARHAESERARLQGELEAMTAARDHCKAQATDAGERLVAANARIAELEAGRIPTGEGEQHG